MPPFPQTKPNFSGGWGSYLKWRGGNSLVQEVTHDPSILDALSFPVTLLSMLDRLNLVPGSRLAALALGASRRAEERVARSSEMWRELSNHFPNTNIELWLIGPEISSSETLNKSERMSISLFKGTYVEFAKNNRDVVTDRHNTIHITYNGGFGNFPESMQFDLLSSWLPDLRLLASLRTPLIFTAANDFGDLRGESAVMHLLGANWCCPPTENPFSFATTLVGEGFKPGKRLLSFTAVLKS
jgi:hypothetical protein